MTFPFAPRLLLQDLQDQGRAGPFGPRVMEPPEVVAAQNEHTSAHMGQGGAKSRKRAVSEKNKDSGAGHPQDPAA